MQLKTIAILAFPLLYISSHTFAGSGAIFTSLKHKDCKRITTDPFYVAQCQAKGNYQLHVVGSDLRYGADLKYQQHTVRYQPVAPFTVGNTAEWRFRDIAGKRHFHALIYRVRIAQMDKQAANFLPRKFDKQQLVVVHLNKNKSCVIGVVKQQKNMNQKARKIADKKGASCLKTDF